MRTWMPERIDFAELRGAVLSALPEPAPKRGQQAEVRRVTEVDESHIQELLDILHQEWKEGQRNFLQEGGTYALYLLGCSPPEIEEIGKQYIPAWQKEKGLLDTAEQVSKWVYLARHLEERLAERKNNPNLPRLTPTPQGMPDAVKQAIWDVLRRAFKKGKGIRTFLALRFKERMEKDENGKKTTHYVPVVTEARVSASAISVFEKEYPDVRLSNPREFSWEMLKDHQPVAKHIRDLVALQGKVESALLLPERKVVLTIRNAVIPRRNDYIAVRNAGVEDVAELVNLLGYGVKKLFGDKAALALRRFTQIYDALHQVADRSEGVVAHVLSLVAEGNTVKLAAPVSLSSEYAKDVALDVHEKIKEPPSEELRRELGNRLSLLKKPQNIIIGAHAIAALTRQIIHASVYPGLLVIGKESTGKTRTARIWSIVPADTPKTAHQFAEAAHGFGMGTILLDELEQAKNDLIQLLKTMTTTPLWTQIWGREKRRRLAGVSPVIAANSLPLLSFMSPADARGLIRRFVAVFPTAEDADDSPEVADAVAWLEEQKWDVLAAAVEFLRRQKPHDLRALYAKAVKENGPRLGFIHYGLALYGAFLEWLGSPLPPEVLHAAWERVKQDTAALSGRIAAEEDTAVADVLVAAARTVALSALRTLQIRNDNTVLTDDDLTMFARDTFETVGVAVEKLDSERLRILFNGAGARRIITELKRSGVNVPGTSGTALISLLERRDVSGSWSVELLGQYNRKKLGDAYVKSHEVVLIRTKDESGGVEPIGGVESTPAPVESVEAEGVFETW